MNKAIFLDRDGTINVEKHYLYKIKSVKNIQFRRQMSVFPIVKMELVLNGTLKMEKHLKKQHLLSLLKSPLTHGDRDCYMSLNTHFSVVPQEVATC